MYLVTWNLLIEWWIQSCGKNLNVVKKMLNGSKYSVINVLICLSGHVFNMQMPLYID